MSNPDPQVTPTPIDAAEIETLLGRAAALAADAGLAPEAFMQAAWKAFMDARPGLREELEVKQLRAQLRKLRKRGLLASA